MGLLNYLALGSTAQEFRSASACRPGFLKGSDCLEQRAIEITAVATGRYGRVNTVDFLDGGDPHESHLSLVITDTSVLQPGASGTAQLWRDKYTNLDVAGIDFVTDENPVGRQSLWLLVAVVGVAFTLILGAASVVWRRMNREAAD